MTCIFGYELFFTSYFAVKTMTDCQGDGEGTVSPMELFEKLNAQGEKVRSLKSAKAEKVSDTFFQIYISIFVQMQIVISGSQKGWTDDFPEHCFLSWHTVIINNIKVTRHTGHHWSLYYYENFDWYSCGMDVTLTRATVTPPWQWHYLTTPMSIGGPFKNIMIDCTLNPQRSGVHACFGSKGRTSSWWVYCNYIYCNSDIAPHLLTVDMYKSVHKSCIWMNISQTNLWLINIFIPEVVHTYRRN